MLTKVHRSSPLHVIAALTHTMSFPQCFERESTHPPTLGFPMKTLRNDSPSIVHYMILHNDLQKVSPVVSHA